MARSFFKLPEDLQINIFLRLPVKCLLICKCVCKPFRTIIQSPNFTNAHLNCTRPTAAKSSSLILGLIENDMTACLNNLLSVDNTGEILSSSPLTPPIPYVGALFLVGSCNGLICFDVLLNYYTSESNLLLWNPVTRQTRYLPRLENHSKCDVPITEFGFVRETNEYMVVNVLRSSESYNIAIELYRMSTDTWTVYSNTTVGKLIPSLGPGFSLDRGSTSVFSNGCFHWVTKDSIGPYIVSFSLKNEELGMIKAVDHDSFFNIWKVAVVEEDLAMIYWNFSNGFEIWVMTDYGDEGSWVLKFDIDYYVSSSLHPVGYFKYGMMIIEIDPLYCLLDLNTGEVEDIPDMDPISWTLIKFCSFEESFAPVWRLL